MRQYTSEEIQAQFDKLPAEVQQAVTSTEVHDKIEGVGMKYGLMIDQLGELVDEIGLVLLGLHRSADFVTQISQRLNISSKAASTIAQDVNTEVFGSIKDYLKKVEDEIAEQDSMESAEENRSTTVSSLERVGGFEVEKPEVETGQNGVTSADKASILAGVENPEPTVPAMQGSPTHVHNVDGPANLPTGTPTWSKGQTSAPAQQSRSSIPAKPSIAPRPSPSSASTISQPAPKPIQKPAPGTASYTQNNEQHTEPIVDFLLGNAAASPARSVVSEPPQAKPTARPVQSTPTPSKKSGPDPYREQVQ